MTEHRSHRTLASFDDAVGFHGHACPGLALGYRVAVAAMHRLDVSRAEDEDLVAVVENDACSVDAVQFVCGCTFGKGNLVFRDHGKHVYTFFNRATGKGLRIYAEPPKMEEGARVVGRGSGEDVTTPRPVTPAPPTFLPDRIEWLLSLPEDDLLSITEVQEPPPSKARIHASSRCSLCGERMMESRARNGAGEPLCIPCAQNRAGGLPPAARL